MTAGAAAASPHDLDQESFMKIAVKNLSGLAALLLFAAATLATAYAHDRKTIDLGTVTSTTVDADSDAAQKALAFDPTRLTDGIELSDDPLPALPLSGIHRQGPQETLSAGVAGSAVFHQGHCGSGWKVPRTTTKEMS